MIKRYSALAGALLFCLLGCPRIEAQPTRVVSVVEKEVRLNGDIRIAVDTLGNNPTGKQPPLLPYLNGYPMKGSTLRFVDLQKKVLLFTLGRNSTDSGSRHAWNRILGGLGPFKRTYTVSIGAEDSGPVASDVTVIFEVYPSPWSQIAILVLIVLVVAFLVLVFKTDILKDPKEDGRERAYSLGRFQMAWWFLIILASFTYIWMVTGDLGMPETSLVLMGISSATALGAILVKPNPKKPSVRGKSTLGRFFVELLGNGEDPVTLHRFQMLAWTMILSVIFIAGVFKDLAQPVLDSSLLTLMGISSGSYVGFKFPEKS